MSLSTRVLFPVPGGPVTPRMNACPGGFNIRSNFDAPARSFSTSVIPFESARLSPPRISLAS